MAKWNHMVTWIKKFMGVQRKAIDLLLTFQQQFFNGCTTRKPCSVEEPWWVGNLTKLDGGYDTLAPIGVMFECYMSSARLISCQGL